MPVSNNNYLGKQVGSYHVVDRLGSGGFADVYLGEHIYLKTQSAIKMLHVQLSKYAIQNFLHEAKIIARLEHPNIVRVLDYGVQDGNPFLVMSYAPNGTLRQRHPRGTHLPLDLIVSYVQQAASALDYAHQSKLIHRDVKPGNMLIGQKQQLLLSDFGLALAVADSDFSREINIAIFSSDSQPEVSIIDPVSNSQSDISRTVSSADSQPDISLENFSSSSESEIHMAGTIPYTAPEQIQGKACYASDQYALGIITYEWICGEYPFTGSFMKIAMQHVLAAPASLTAKVPNLSPEVEGVIFKALAKDPTQRFASVSDFAQALQQAYQGQAVAPTAISIYTNTTTLLHEGTPPPDKNNFNANDPKKQQSIIPTPDIRSDTTDKPNKNTASPEGPIHNAPTRSETSFAPTLYPSHHVTNTDTTYDTLKLPAEADITYHTSKLPFTPVNNQPTTYNPLTPVNIQTTIPNPPISNTTSHATLPSTQRYKRNVRFTIRDIAIVVLLISLVSLGAIWYSNIHTNNSASSSQRQSILLHSKTQPADQKTQQGLPTRKAGTPPTTPTPNAVLASDTPTTSIGNTTNPPSVSSTPGTTPKPAPTPTPMPVADCLQGSVSAIHFMSPPNPLVPRSRQFTLTNCGGAGSTNWQATIQNSSWLNLSVSSGSLDPGSSIVIQIQTDVSNLAAGTYANSITFTAGNASWIINIVYDIR